MIAFNVREQWRREGSDWVICNGDQKAPLHRQLDMQMAILIGHTPHAVHYYLPHFRVRMSFHLNVD